MVAVGQRAQQYLQRLFPANLARVEVPQHITAKLA